MDANNILRLKVPDRNPIALLILTRLRLSINAPPYALIDEMNDYLVDEQNNYLTDKE